MAAGSGPPNYDVAADGKRVIAILDAESSRPGDTHLRILLHVDEMLRSSRAEDKRQ